MSNTPGSLTNLSERKDSNLNSNEEKVATNTSEFDADASISENAPTDSDYVKTEENASELDTHRSTQNREDIKFEGILKQNASVDNFIQETSKSQGVDDGEVQSDNRKVVNTNPYKYKRAKPDIQTEGDSISNLNSSELNNIEASLIENKKEESDITNNNQNENLNSYLKDIPKDGEISPSENKFKRKTANSKNNIANDINKTQIAVDTTSESKDSSIKFSTFPNLELKNTQNVSKEDIKESSTINTDTNANVDTSKTQDFKSDEIKDEEITDKHTKIIEESVKKIQYDDNEINRQDKVKRNENNKIENDQVEANKNNVSEIIPQEHKKENKEQQQEKNQQHEHHQEPDSQHEHHQEPNEQHGENVNAIDSDTPEKKEISNKDKITCSIEVEIKENINSTINNITTNEYASSEIISNTKITSNNINNTNPINSPNLINNINDSNASNTANDNGTNSDSTLEIKNSDNHKITTSGDNLTHTTYCNNKFEASDVTSKLSNPTINNSIDPLNSNFSHTTTSKDEIKQESLAVLANTADEVVEPGSNEDTLKHENKTKDVNLAGSVKDVFELSDENSNKTKNEVNIEIVETTNNKVLNNVVNNDEMQDLNKRNSTNYVENNLVVKEEYKKEKNRDEVEKENKLENKTNCTLMDESVKKDVLNILDSSNFTNSIILNNFSKTEDTEKTSKTFMDQDKLASSIILNSPTEKNEYHQNIHPLKDQISSQEAIEDNEIGYNNSKQNLELDLEQSNKLSVGNYEKEITKSDSIPDSNSSEKQNPIIETNIFYKRLASIFASVTGAVFISYFIFKRFKK